MLRSWPALRGSEHRGAPSKKLPRESSLPCVYASTCPVLRPYTRGKGCPGRKSFSPVVCLKRRATVPMTNAVCSAPLSTILTAHRSRQTEHTCWSKSGQKGTGSITSLYQAEGATWPILQGRWRRDFEGMEGRPNEQGVKAGEIGYTLTSSLPAICALDAVPHCAQNCAREGL
jgi:hypothetical protein